MSRLKLVLSMVVVLLLAVSVGTALAQEPEAEAPRTAVISDDAAMSDAIAYSLTNAPPPTDGTEYVGWLISDDGSTKLSTGIMTVAGNGSISYTFGSETARYTGENLIAGYSSVAITEETIGADPDAPAGAIAFSAKVPIGAMVHIRHLIVDFPAGSGTGIVADLQRELGVALTHAMLADKATTLAGVKTHLEHTINAVEGPGGANYGDLDGNGTIQDFGDGTGALAYAATAQAHADLAIDRADGNEAVVEHGELLKTAVQGAVIRANQAVKEALFAANETNLSFAKLSVAGIVNFLQNALNGFDLNASGVIESTLDQGGAAQAYREAQLMATYTLQVGPPPTPTAAPTATPVPPTATPVPPTATPIPPETVGDPAIPQLAQLALLASLVFLVGGGLVVLSRRPRA